MPWFPDIHTGIGLAGGRANALGRPERVVLSVGKAAHGSLDLTYVGPSLALGRHRGVGSTSLEHLGPLTTLCSHCRDLLAAPVPKPEKVRKSLEHEPNSGSKLEHYMTLPTLCLDSDHEDGNYCPPVKRERTSSLTHSGKQHPPEPGRASPSGDTWAPT